MTKPATFLQLGPFVLNSEIDLPELREAAEQHARRIDITLGVVEADREPLVRLDEFCAFTETKYLLDIPGVARYFAEDGTRVRVEMYPGAAAEDVRGYLLGSVFGALCHQNGYLPLHASAVLGPRGVTAFLGDSGAGKSTTAAFLEQRGYRVVSDDICLLDLSGDALRVTPVAGWLKLWQESFDRLGESPTEGTRIFSEKDKYRRYLPQENDSAMELVDVVFLEQDAALEAPVLERASASHAVAGLMRLTYLAYLPELNGVQAAHMAQISRVLSQARAYRLRRPWGWESLPAALTTVEARLLSGG